jgi:hypothetical protein
MAGKIKACRITKSASLFDVPEVFVVYAGQDEEHKLFDYYPDEISFTEREFIGLTEAEAHTLKGEKDLAFLRS